MNPWTSYQLQDFIPFTEEVYFRLLERMGETFWPLHLLTLGLGAATLVLALQHRRRIACLLPAPLWAFVAVAFFIQRYAALNWAGGYVGYAFTAQAALLVVIALTGWGMDKASRSNTPPIIMGTAITLFGLILMPLLMPLISPLSGSSWYQAEVFGIHADPTAVTTLGLVLITLRGYALWIAAIIPALWLVVSGLTLLALHATTGGAVLFAVLAITLVGLVWKSIEVKR